VTHFYLQWLSLLPAFPFLALVVAFCILAGLFSDKPGLKQGGFVEMGLGISNDLSRGYTGWFVDS
jgi:hypothetical protein